MDLHHESGLKALKDAGLMEEFKAHARFEGDALRILDKTGKVHFEKPSDNIKSEDNPRARPEIDRYVHTVIYALILQVCIPLGKTYAPSSSILS